MAAAHRSARCRGATCPAIRLGDEGADALGGLDEKAVGQALEQEGVRVARAGQRVYVRARRRRAARCAVPPWSLRASARRRRRCASADRAPRAAASGQRQQPDRGDCLRPAVRAGVERAAVGHNRKRPLRRLHKEAPPPGPLRWVLKALSPRTFPSVSTTANSDAARHQ